MRAFDDWSMALVDKDPFMAHFPTRRVRHRGPSRSVVGDGVAVNMPQEAMEASATLPPDAPRLGDVEAHTAAVAEIAHQTLSVTVPRLLESVGVLQEAAGRNPHEPFENPWDGLLRSLEEIDLTFDEAGNAAVPTLMLNAETNHRLLSTPQPPDYEERHAAIIDKKRDKWNAEKRRRRLPRQHQA